MKTFRVGNDIVAAHDEAEAIRVWANETTRPVADADPVEEIDPAQTAVAAEDEDGATNADIKTIADLLPVDEPCVLAVGSCDCG